MTHMPKRWAKRYRRMQTGHFTQCLVSAEALKAALKTLLDDTERYIITIKRSSFNWDSGKNQEAELTIFEGDQLDLADAVDPRLLRSRRVTVVLADKGNGVAKIDLTARSWEIVGGGSAMREKLISANAQLLDGVRSRFITPGYIALTMLAPLWSVLLVLASWTLASPRTRHLSNANPYNQAAFNASFPQWTDTYTHAAFILWPIFIFIGLVMITARLLSGGLRIWPESFTFKSIVGAFYRIRISTFTPGNATVIVTGIIIAVVSALITLLFTHI